MAIIYNMNKRLQAAARCLGTTAPAAFFAAALAVGCSQESQVPKPEKKPDQYDKPDTVSALVEYAAADDYNHTAASDPASILNGDAVPITEDDTHFLQRRLNEMGYDAGPEDGIYGPKTESGLLAMIEDRPSALALMGRDVLHNLIANGHRDTLQHIARRDRAAYLEALHTIRGKFPLKDLQYHLKYIASFHGEAFYNGSIDGIRGDRTKRALRMLRAHVDPPRLEDFEDKYADRNGPSMSEIKNAVKRGDVEWLRWNVIEDNALSMRRPVGGDYNIHDKGAFFDKERDGRHLGVDYNKDGYADYGKVLTPGAPGRVIYAGKSYGYGLTVIIEHSPRIYTLWAHLKDIDVQPGQYINTDTAIGTLGNSGHSNGPHLHYEVLAYDGRQAIALKIPLENGIDLSDPATIRFKIAQARNIAQKNGFHHDDVVSAAFNVRALGQKPAYEHHPRNVVDDFQNDFDVRTAYAMLDLLTDNRNLLAQADARMLYKLGRTPAGEKLAQTLHNAPQIAQRIERDMNQGNYRQAQLILAASDDYHGAMDGIIGPKSRHALNTFRQASDYKIRITRHDKARPKEPS